MAIGIRTGCDLDRRLFEIWRKMHYRCESETHLHYHRYGGRGIKVCEEWGSLIVFGKWALENGYAPDLTLDRIDNDGDYTPANCRWSTCKEQANNRSVKLAVEFDAAAYTPDSSIMSPAAVIIKPRTVKKPFSVRQRGKKWEYRIEAEKVNGKRQQVTKCGYPTKEAAIEAATGYIKENARTKF